MYTKDHYKKTLFFKNSANLKKSLVVDILKNIFFLTSKDSSFLCVIFICLFTMVMSQTPLLQEVIG